MKIRNIESVCDLLLSEENNDSILIDIDSNRKYGLLNWFIENPYTNIGFRLGYFLWIMRGSNTLKQISYYGDHVKLWTDDRITLRGAYGPRLRYWVGADQLEEAIKQNIDIDNPEDMVKPKGVDQLQSVFKDLESGLQSSGCVVFNPAIDFDDSKNIPELLSIVFSMNSKNELDIFGSFTSSQIDGCFINDLFFMTIWHLCMSNILKVVPGHIRCFIGKPIWDKHISKFDNYKVLDKFEVIGNDTPEKMFDDLTCLMSFEKHLRCCIDTESVVHPKVNLINHCDMLVNKYLDNIKCPFWKSYGISLMVFCLNKYGDKRYNEYCVKNSEKYVNIFKPELSWRMI
jgi:hypothetical protein